MNILITGAFGNVGRQVIIRAFSAGHCVSVMEMNTRRNRRIAFVYRRKLSQVFLGDIRDKSLLDASVKEQDAVIHLAAMLPPTSEQNPALCESVNVDGTANIIRAMKNSLKCRKLVFISSASVMGPTQEKEPPVRISDPVAPVDSYARSKVKAEALVLSSGMETCVLRLAAVLPTGRLSSIKMLTAAFELPLDARCEAITDIDVAEACIKAVEEAPRLRRKVFFISGGKDKGWQMSIREMYRTVFEPAGLSLPDDRLFTNNPNNFSIDWYDTSEAQECLNYQKTGFEQYKRILSKKLRPIRPIVRFLNPVVQRVIADISPYGK